MLSVEDVSSLLHTAGNDMGHLSRLSMKYCRKTVQSQVRDARGSKELCSKPGQAVSSRGNFENLPMDDRN